MNKIMTASLTDIAVVNNRYAIVRDLTGTYRVVSLVRLPARELQPNIRADGNATYTFNRTGTGPCWDKTTYSQAGLESIVSRYGKGPTHTQYDQLRNAVEVVANGGPLNGKAVRGATPVSNYVLDPGCGGWIIATVSPTGLLFGSKPKVHTSQPAAEAELQRLATVSPGTEFVLFKAAKTAVTQTVQTKTFA